MCMRLAIVYHCQVYMVVDSKAQQIWKKRTMQVRLVQEAQAALKRDSRTVHRSTSASKLPTTEEKARIREQMEADRLERASKKTKN